MVFGLIYRWIIDPIVKNILRFPRLHLSAEAVNIPSTSKDPIYFFMVIRLLRGGESSVSTGVISSKCIVRVTVENQGEKPVLVHEVGIRVYYPTSEPDDRRRSSKLSGTLRMRVSPMNTLLSVLLGSDRKEKFSLSSKDTHIRIRSAESRKVDVANIETVRLFVDDNSEDGSVILVPYCKVDHGTHTVQHESIVTVAIREFERTSTVSVERELLGQLLSHVASRRR